MHYILPAFAEPMGFFYTFYFLSCIISFSFFNPHILQFNMENQKQCVYWKQSFFAEA